MVRSFLNSSEALVSLASSQVLSQTRCGLQLHWKVRVADVLAEPASVPRRWFWYYLSSHFDFVLAFGLWPVFAIEFDGPLHQQRDAARRDRIKNALAQDALFPVLRVRERDIFPTAAPFKGRLSHYIALFERSKQRYWPSLCFRCQGSCCVVGLSRWGCPVCGSQIIRHVEVTSTRRAFMSLLRHDFYR